MTLRRLRYWTGAALLASVTIAACSDDGPSTCPRPVAISGDLQPRWSATLGDGIPVGMRLRSDGSLIAVVQASDRLTIAGTLIPVSIPAPLVVAFDPDGKVLWHRLLDGMGTVLDFAVDGAGNTYLIRDQLIRAMTGMPDGPVYLAKLDPDGNVVFTQTLDVGLRMDATIVKVTSLAVAADAGQVVVAGTAAGVASFGSFIGRYDPAGKQVSLRMGATRISTEMVALDSAGGVVVAGRLYGDLDWAPTPVSVHNGAFVLYLDAGDRVLWARTLGEGAWIDALAIDRERSRAFLAVPSSVPLAIDGEATSPGDSATSSSSRSTM